MRLRSVMLVALVLASLAVGACGADATDGDTVPTIVATTTILGDVAGQIAGDGATVEVLMPLGADPHDFQASAAQIALINRADLVVANGLGLEEGLDDVLEAAESDGVVVLELGPELEPLPLDHTDDGDGHGGEDPHVWFDPIRMAQAAGLIGDALESAAPGGDWTNRAERYAQELVSTDEHVAELLSAVPDERRKLVTSHASLGYFANRYDFEVVGVVIPGGSTLGDPSSEELARLIDTIRSAGIRVIFAETTQTTSLVDAVVSELGGQLTVVDLYTESLGEPGSGADSLIGLLTTNAERIAGALGD